MRADLVTYNYIKNIWTFLSNKPFLLYEQSGIKCNLVTYLKFQLSWCCQKHPLNKRFDRAILQPEHSHHFISSNFRPFLFVIAWNFQITQTCVWQGYSKEWVHCGVYVTVSSSILLTTRGNNFGLSLFFYFPIVRETMCIMPTNLVSVKRTKCLLRGQRSYFIIMHGMGDMQVY